MTQNRIKVTTWTVYEFDVKMKMMVLSWLLIFSWATLGAARQNQELFASPEPECQIDKTERVDCGWKGITKDECLGKGCCFNNNIPGLGVIWCYGKKENVLINTNVGATCAASSEVNLLPFGLDFYFLCQQTFDGDLNSQWLANESNGAYIAYSFDVPVLLQYAKVWQICANNSQFRQYDITLADGTTFSVNSDTACDGSNGICLSNEFTFSMNNVVTTGVTITLNGDCDPRVNYGVGGLREVELWGWPATPRCRDDTCSPRYWYCPSSESCGTCGTCV